MDYQQYIDISNEEAEAYFEENVKNDYEDIKKKAKAVGLDNLHEHIREKLDAWKKVPVNLAVIGNRGVGKSTLINSMRGLKNNDPGAAKVGSTETTMAPTEYDFPDNPNVKLWDLPGMSTLRFPKEKYLEIIKVERYDCFLILGEESFGEDELNLAKELRARGKFFVFVRTKIDLAINNEQEDNNLTPDETMAKVLGNLLNSFEDSGLQDSDIFLVNCKKPRERDFPNLLRKILQCLPEIKRTTMTFAMQGLTEYIVESKRKTLKKRVLAASFLSAAGSMQPVPGLGLAIDVGVMVHEIRFYIMQLGLDERSLDRLAVEYRTTREHLSAQIQDCQHLLHVSKETIAYALTRLGIAVAATAVDATASILLKTVLPIIGGFITAPISFGATYYTLNKILTFAIADGKRVLSAAMASGQTGN